MNKKRKLILIVEDEADERELLDDLLRDTYDLLFAKTGMEAVTIFQDKHQYIDLILLDINLPDINAFEVFKYLEAICLTAIPNIIVVTAYSKSPDIIKTMTETRAFDHLTKPFKNHELLEAIEKGLKTTFTRKEYEVSQEALLNQIHADRNIYMIVELQELRYLQGQELTPNDITPFFTYHKTLPTLPDLLKTLENDTGEKAAPPWTPKILIIEDEPDFRQRLKDHLIDQNMSVITASSADDGLTLVKEHTDIDIIILDLNLPDHHGHHVITEINKEVTESWDIQANANPDIIVITSYDDRATIVNTIKSGAHKYLTKPVELHEISDEINSTFFRRYCIHVLPDLLTILKKQRAPFRFRFDVLNKRLKSTSSNTMTLNEIYGFFREYEYKKLADTITIPKKTDEDLREFLYQLNIEAKAQKLKISSIPTPSFSPESSKGTLLFIEDEEDYLEILIEFFGRKEFTVYHATNSHDALHILNTIKPIDVVILDYTLQDSINGIDLAQKITNSNPETEVFLHTAHDNLTLPNLSDKLSKLKKVQFVSKGSVKNLYDKIIETLSL